MRFHSGEISVQERAGVRDIAEDVGEGTIDHVSAGVAEFLERRQMAVLGTVGELGRVWASVVTGEPGFIETVGDRTLRIAAQISSGDPLLHNLATEGHAALFAPDFVA
jgi:predicted pyridoxine 5'-phosphate oxidase superfamily flavin-nucleotide-binding protein